jgi:glycosyltransferase involved in cell wall biosynthesis
VNLPAYLVAVGACAERLFELTARIMVGRVSPWVTDDRRAPVAERCAIATRRPPHNPPEVSVIIPTCDRPDLLLAAVDSVHRQGPVDIEIVIVNDSDRPLGSAVLEGLAATPRPITVAQHHQNLGPGAARNTGAEFASGTWLLMLDDDDTLVDGILRTLLDVGCGTGTPFVFGDHIRQRYAGVRPTQMERVSVGLEALEQLHAENPIMCGSFVIERSVFDAVGGYREDLRVHEDYNLHLRVLSQVRPAHVAAPVCIYHRRETLPRLNHRRLHWFAASAFNHAVFRALFERTGDRALKVAQREYQYAHLERSLDEGCPPDIAWSLVTRWRQTLEAHGLLDEIAIDEDVIARLYPSVRR